MSGRTLRIGIDAHAIGQRQTGNERFIGNLIRGLRAVCEHELVLFFSRPEAAAGWPRDERTEVRVMRPDHPASRLLWHFPTRSRRDHLDVLLVQSIGTPLAACPVVAIVHDVAFAVYPSYFSRLERLWMPVAIPATMRRAAGVVTVSEFSRDEISRLYEIPSSRITVAYNAVDPIFRESHPGPAKVAPPYFLTIGNLQPRKNLLTLIRAYRELVDRDPRTAERLVIVGQEFYAAEPVLREGADLARAGRIVFTGYLPDREMVALLRQATAFAYPSVYEGFGLPVIEAMATGVATLVADVPVMREVAGDAALRLPPTDASAWAEALIRVAADGPYRKDLGRRAIERVRRFSPEACAREVLVALERAVATRRRPRA